jgi:hypothetical protein
VKKAPVLVFASLALLSVLAPALARLLPPMTSDFLFAATFLFGGWLYIFERASFGPVIHLFGPRTERLFGALLILLGISHLMPLFGLWF